MTKLRLENNQLRFHIKNSELDKSIQETKK